MILSGPYLSAPSPSRKPRPPRARYSRWSGARPLLTNATHSRSPGRQGGAVHAMPTSSERSTSVSKPGSKSNLELQKSDQSTQGSDPKQEHPADQFRLEMCQICTQLGNTLLEPCLKS